MNVKKIKNERTQLLNYLWEFQNAKGYISTSDIRTLSRELDLSWIEIEGIVSFFHFFTKKPTGKYTIYLNNSIISEISGFQKIKKAFENETNSKFGETDPTGTFSLFETACIGLSDQEVAALINFKPVTKLTPKKVKFIINHLKNGNNLDDIIDTPKDYIQYKNGEKKAILFQEYIKGNTILNLIQKKPNEIIQEIKNSGLSGRGGAFFPTGLKWEFAKQSEGLQKYVICNADEGEPGTFKDRVLLNQMPGLLLEGMIVGGYAIGATKGIIYLRAEYTYLKGKIQKEINHFYDIGLLGNDILGKNFNFDITIMSGAGAYVCGAETALIESLEGYRGVPLLRLFYPVEKGYLNKPTIVNNVETFCAAARIIEKGAKSFNSLGTENRKGTILLSISGHCSKPGIYEIEWGMTINEMLDLCGAKDTNFIQFSGPSGKLLTKKDFNKIIGSKELSSGGSVMIFNSKTDIFKMLANFSNFFTTESCGSCTPCRAGNYLVRKRIEKIINNQATNDEIQEVKEWSKIIQATSRCGLGKTSTNFIIDAIDKFPELFKKKALKNKEFDLSYALNDYYDYVKQN